jgi:hypothetical protein
MSEPVTLYKEVARNALMHRMYVNVGSFVEWAWCAFHNEPMAGEVVREDGERACWLSVLREDFSRCVIEPLPRLVQKRES